MNLRAVSAVTILLLALAAPAFAADSFAGFARVTVYNTENSALPEITVQSCTERLFAGEAEARAAADDLLAAAERRAREQARAIWGEAKAARIKVSEESVFAKRVAAPAKGEQVFYRGLVAQGFIFKLAGEQKLVYHSEVTAAFKNYDAAYQAAKALAPVCKKNALARIVAQFGVAESAVEMVSVTFDVDLTDRDDPDYVPRYRGMVVHGFSFKVNGEGKYVQKAGVTPVFATYDEAMHGARAMAEKNFKEGRAEIMAQYGLPQDAVQLLSVVFDVDLM